MDFNHNNTNNSDNDNQNKNQNLNYNDLKSDSYSSSSSSLSQNSSNFNDNDLISVNSSSSQSLPVLPPPLIITDSFKSQSQSQSQSSPPITPLNISSSTPLISSSSPSLAQFIDNNSSQNSNVDIFSNELNHIKNFPPSTRRYVSSYNNLDNHTNSHTNNFNNKSSDDKYMFEKDKSAPYPYNSRRNYKSKFNQSVDYLLKCINSLKVTIRRNPIFSLLIILTLGYLLIFKTQLASIESSNTVIKDFDVNSVPKTLKSGQRSNPKLNEIRKNIKAENGNKNFESFAEAQAAEAEALAALAAEQKKQNMGLKASPPEDNPERELIDNQDLYFKHVPGIDSSKLNYKDTVVVDLDLNTYYESTYEYPTLPPDTPRASAAFVILCSNKDLHGIHQSLIQLERNFNHKYNYPYVFLNDEPFTDEFIKKVKTLISSKAQFGLVDNKHFSIPDHLEEKTVLQCLQNMEKNGIYKGGLLSYHYMCRFYSGFFFKHPLITQYEYYWRVEPDVNFFCDIDYDPFMYMHLNNKVYGFTVAIGELMNTIPNLFDVVKRYALTKGLIGEEAPLMSYFTHTDDEDWLLDEEYNGCHFWTNFEIARVDVWNNDDYGEFFEFLDRWGGFFFERWGDAPIHSLWLGLKYRYDQVHFFHDIGYSHDNVFQCVEKGPLFNKCLCPSIKMANKVDQRCIDRWMGYIPGPWKPDLNNFRETSITSADRSFESWYSSMYDNSNGLAKSTAKALIDARFILEHSIVV